MAHSMVAHAYVAAAGLHTPPHGLETHRLHLLLALQIIMPQGDGYAGDSMHVRNNGGCCTVQ